VEIAMKSQLILTCVCLGMLGITLSCGGDEEATTVTAESASAQSADDNGQDSAAKSAESKNRASGKRKANKAKGDENVDRSKMTNSDCFPTSVPDSAPTNAKLCIALAASKPDMLFPKHDYDAMPEDCKPIVFPKCR